MKEFSHLENRFRSWTPRPPSEKTKRRLFGRPPASSRTQPRLLWPWLAPATVTLFMSVLLLGHSRQGLTSLSGRPASDDVATALLGTPYFASASYLESPRNDRNAWAKATFEWTNRSHSLTTPPVNVENHELAPALP